jgi:pimeloyl-ACP methyl ester carboxylesterase
MVNPAGPLAVRTWGDGPPLLFLHGLDGLLYCEPFLTALAQEHQVVAPSAPGWGPTPRQRHLRTLDDVSYLFLDLIEQFGEPVPVVGTSLGAWLAAEIATKSCSSISSLVLVSPLGIRQGDPLERHFLDLYATPPEDVRAAMYGDEAVAPDLAAQSDDHFLELARAEEATAALTWEPYMHNPALPARLHRITVPTLLVRGERDGFMLRTDGVETYRTGISGPTELAVVPDAGHRVEETSPARLAELVTEFVARSTIKQLAEGRL